MPEIDGDKHLSTQDIHLWSLIYSTIERFCCLTIFRKIGPNYPLHKDCYITFFVPRSHPKAKEVKEYLDHEAKGLVFVQRQTDEDWYPNTIIQVLYYSGLEPYLERDTLEVMVENAMDTMMLSISERIQRKIKGDEI